MLHAFRPLRSPCGIHGRVSSADDDDIFADIQVSVLFLKVSEKLQRIDRIAFFQLQPARLRSSHCKDHCRVPGIFQHTDIRDLGIQINVYAQLLKERRVLVNGALRDTESRDHMAHHAAQGAALLKQRHIHARSSQEVRRRHSRRSAADDCGLSGSCHSRSRDLSDQGVIAVLSRDLFHLADMYRILIEIAGAFSHARVGADCSRDERERVLLRDHLQCLFVFSCFHKLQVRRDILMDGTSLFARSGEAVQERHLFFHLSRRQGLHCLHMIRAHLRVRRKLRRLFRTDHGKYILLLLQERRHLRGPVVSAGFEQCGGNGDRPDAGVHDAFDIVVIRAARVGDAQLSAKLFRQFRRQGDGQRVQGLP